MLASEMALAIIEVQRNRAEHNTLQTMKYELIVYVEKLSEFGAIGFESCTDTVDGQEYNLYKAHFNTEKDQAGQVIRMVRGIPAECHRTGFELRVEQGFLYMEENGFHQQLNYANEDAIERMLLLIEATALAAGLDYDVLEIKRVMQNYLGHMAA